MHKKSKTTPNICGTVQAVLSAEGQDSYYRAAGRSCLITC